MCRYAMYGPYKSHFACFDCRKAFKQPPIQEWLGLQGKDYAYRELYRLWSRQERLEQREQELGIRLADLQFEYKNSHKCPECSQPMADLGLDFKAPRHSDTRAWKAVHGAYRVGHAFHTCGCEGPGFIPKTPTEYREYLEARHHSYVMQLRSCQESSELTSERKHEAAEYWATRLSAIEREMSAIA